jgi:hypothetical protein
MDLTSVRAAAPSLQDFSDSAQKGPAVRVVDVDGQQFTVQALGQLPGQASSRTVAWVQSNPNEGSQRTTIDATQPVAARRSCDDIAGAISSSVSASGAGFA